MDTELFGVPLRIELGFVASVVLVVWSLGDVGRIGTFTVLAFFSVLVHEVGHVLAFRRAGVDSRVILPSCGGGLTIPFDEVPSRWARVGVYLAGAVTTIVVLGLPGALALHLWPSAPPEWEILLTYLVWLNVWYALFNLLPILPLDGGRVAFELAQVTLGERRAPVVTHVLSVVTAAVAAVGIVVAIGDHLLGVILAVQVAWLGVTNVTALVSLGDHTMPKVIEAGHKALCDGDVDQAAALAIEAVETRNASDVLRACGVQLLVWVELTRGDVAMASRLLARAPAKVQASAHLQCALGAVGPGDQVALAVRGFNDLASLVPPPVYAGVLAEHGVLSDVADALLAADGPEAIDARSRFFLFLFRAGRYDDATAFGARLLATDWLPGRVAFNLACCRARAGDHEGAIGWLVHSYRGLGYRRLDQLTTDEDIATLRADARFQELCRVLGVVPPPAPSIALAEGEDQASRRVATPR